MSGWTEFKGGAKFRLVVNGNKYTVEQLMDNGSPEIFVYHNQPFTLQQRSGSKFYENFYGYARRIWTGEELDSFPRYYNEFCRELIQNKVLQEELDKVEEAKKKASQEKSKKIHDKYYEDLYSEFRMYMSKYEKSALELIVSCSRCLVADSVREVVRAFVGYFQTINGIKATNVIAIGSPASGKSFILETALSMMPQEFVHHGVMTESAFFETFEGQNLDGHIFALGDLGGIKDDEKTIAFRDLLKALSTDGMVSRTISKGDSKERTPTRQVVRGHPALTYSTAHEEIVNEQEKSRSVILTPQPIDAKSLSIFNFVMENNGVFRDDIDEVYAVKESIKGLVACFNYNESDGFVNPYEYNIIEVLEEKEDYNRKIQEYNATLKVVTLLDNPYSITHDYYLDEDNKPCESKLIFATKRNNLNAMNLFDAVNFLPDEARFGDKLLEYYQPFDLDKLRAKCPDLDSYDDKKSYEDQLLDLLTNVNAEYSIDDERGLGWKKEFFYNSENGYYSELYQPFFDNVFTVSTLKKRFRGKWFNQHKHYLSHRLMRLKDGDVIIKIGSVQVGKGTENIYCLSNNNGSKISEKLPSFNDSSKVSDFKHQAFNLAFPKYSNEWDEFIELDSPNPNERSLTESVEALIPNLPYIKKVVEDA